jgi:hypothetical protein
VERNFANRNVVFLIGLDKIYTLSLINAFVSPIIEKTAAKTNKIPE